MNLSLSRNPSLSLNLPICLHITVAAMRIAEPFHISDIFEAVQVSRGADALENVGWDIERDVIRGRHFHFSQRLLPATLDRIANLEFLWPDELRLLNQLQARTYANMFSLVERFIGSKMPQIRCAHWSDNPVALKALTSFAEQGAKHQALFARTETLVADSMPYGYRFEAAPHKVIEAVTVASTWAVLAFTCHFQMLTKAHCVACLEADSELSPLFKDVLRFHWAEDSQHANFDEVEWVSENARLTSIQRDDAVSDLIGLFGALSEMVRTQAGADTRYFLESNGRAQEGSEAECVGHVLRDAYRWQYIDSGVQHPRYIGLLNPMLSEKQMHNFNVALAPPLC
jgi:hypothetical protein